VKGLFEQAPKLMARLAQQRDYFQDVTSDLQIAPRRSSWKLTATRPPPWA